MLAREGRGDTKCGSWGDSFGKASGQHRAWVTPRQQEHGPSAATRRKTDGGGRCREVLRLAGGKLERFSSDASSLLIEIGGETTHGSDEGSGRRRTARLLGVLCLLQVFCRASRETSRSGISMFSVKRSFRLPFRKGFPRPVREAKEKL